MEKTKTTIATIALVLVLTIAATLMTCLPAANAADIDTYAFLSVVPNPVGVGQTVTVTMWLNLVPPTAGLIGWGDRWEGFEVEVTKPDGSKTTLGPFTSDPVGTQWTQYVPDTVGTWYFQFSWPGQTITFIETNYYKPSTSPKVALTVQEEPITPWPETPLPEDYWERPIEAENRDWWQISGNWIGAGAAYGGGYNASGRFNPYTKAPNSAHIVWKKPIAFGGIVGGEFGSTAYYTGQTYEHKWSPAIIMNGKLFYNTRLGSSSWQGLACVDLRTGEELWFKNGTTITGGQLYNYDSPNQHGVIPYLWGTEGSTMHMYDAFTGDWILDIANASSGTVIFSPKGDMLVYILNGQGNWLAMWNSSKAIPPPQPVGTEAWQWRPPLGATLDWRVGIEWNVTVPDVPGTQSIAGGIGWSTVSPDIILANTAGFVGGTGEVTYVAYNAKTGAQMWVETITVPLGSTGFGTQGPLLDGVFTRHVKETMQWYGYDAYTGKKLWGPTEPRENAWGMFTEVSFIAYGKFYATAFDGMVYCYDLKTGNKLWTYSAGSSGFETPYGSWPFFGGNGFAVADGKIYLPTGEHSPSNPLWRGERLHCIDAETGKGVWSILGWFQNPVIADGYLVALNGYDNQIYSFGKGKTATTVSAAPKVSTKGSSVMIEGTVMDQSPGAKDTPAIDDKDMSEWMQYLYMQKPIPMDAKGVEVTLDAIDPNGNFISIGTAISNMAGDYGLMWTPEIEGKYEIIATFEGSESYWSSYDTTYVGVGPAPSPVGPIEPEPSEAPFITTEIAIIAAVAVAVVIGIAAYWALRKRK